MSVLQILLTVERNLLWFDLALLDFHLISHENNRNISAYTSQMAMPLGDVPVGVAARHIEHNDRALAAGVESIPNPAKTSDSGPITNEP